MTPEEEAVLKAARAWVEARRPVVSVGNKEHLANLAREKELAEEGAAGALTVAVVLYEETL